MVCAVSAPQTAIAGGTERRPVPASQADASSPASSGYRCRTGAMGSESTLLQTLGTWLQMRTTSARAVVPEVVLWFARSGDANQGGEMEVLVGQLDEFDAPLATLEGVAQGERLGGPNGGVTLLLPHPKQGSKARRAVRHCS